MLKRFCAKCGKEYTAANVPPNDGCGGRIDVSYNLEQAKEIFTRQWLDGEKGGLWTYFDLMPLTKRESNVTLGEGNTPLLHHKRLCSEFGLQNVSLKSNTMKT